MAFDEQRARAPFRVYDSSGNLVAVIDQYGINLFAASQLLTLIDVNGITVFGQDASSVGLHPYTGSLPARLEANSNQIWDPAYFAVDETLGQTPRLTIKCARNPTYGLNVPYLEMQGPGGLTTDRVTQFNTEKFQLSGSAANNASFKISGIDQGRGFCTGAWATANTGNIGVGGAFTHTSPNYTYVNGRMYKATLAGAVGNEAGGCTAMALHLHQGGGAIICDFRFADVNFRGFFGMSMLFANNTGVDKTVQLQLGVAANVGTAQILGAVNSPSGFYIEDMGLLSDYNNLAPFSFMV